MAIPGWAITLIAVCTFLLVFVGGPLLQWYGGTQGWWKSQSQRIAEGTARLKGESEAYVSSMLAKQAASMPST